MPPKERKKLRKGRVFPDADEEEETDYSYAASGVEMDKLYDTKKDTSPSSSKDLKDKEFGDKLEKLRHAAKKASLKENALKVITNVRTGVNKWRKYVTTRRQMSQSDGGDDRRKTGGIGLEYDINHGEHGAAKPPLAKTKDKLDGVKGVHQQMIITHNRNLIEYFARLGQSKDVDACVNLEYLESILKAGADINCTDKYGQSILHEVARAWHLDVAKFILLNKADINQPDNYGRTPLHVAAAVDYPEMVNFLIEKGANKEALTKGEHQTPVHFAARNDACLSLKALIKSGCEYKDVRDFKERTPLHVAAELDRSETARFLLELDDPAPAGVEDSSGQAAVAWMIAKMPPVAKLALDQFHTKDRANRKQAYYLNRLEPRKPNVECIGHPRTAMQILVRFRRFDLIEHPIFLTLIRDKWKRYGRLGAVLNTLLNCVFILLWTVQGVIVEYDVRYDYQMPSQWWRIVLFLAAVGFTGWQLKDELAEYINSRRTHKMWKEWRAEEIDQDLNYAHPRWPEEARYLLSEKDALDQQRPQYFNDFWNIFDWVCYFLLLVCIVTHLVDVGYHTNFVARLHIRIMAVTVIVIWLRLLKNARAFSYLGPFIVMLTHMVSDVARFLFLYLEFYFPFACAFWMLFGGTKTPETFQGTPEAANNTVSVGGMATVDALLFTLFRLTLVDDYDYDGMKAVDSIMADIMVGTWLALSAVLMLNLLIALLSDTFQRVYDNARANAVMQKAITILGIEEGLNNKRREKFRKFIHEKCSPKEDDYDDDEVQAGGEDLQKVTIQIKEQLDEMEHKLTYGLYNKQPKVRSAAQGSAQDRSRLTSVNSAITDTGDTECVTQKTFTSEMGVLREEIDDIRTAQTSIMDRFKRDMRTVKDLLQQIVVTQQGEFSGYPALPGAVDGAIEESPVDAYDTVLAPGTMVRPMSGAYMRAVEVPPPMYSSYSTIAGVSAGRPPRPPMQTHTTRTPQGTPVQGRTLQQDWAVLDHQRSEDLQQLRVNLAQRAELNSARTTDNEHSLDDNEHSLNGVLSGSQLVVEVSEQNIPPPPYRSDTDTQAPGDTTTY